MVIETELDQAMNNLDQFRRPRTAPLNLFVLLVMLCLTSASTHAAEQDGPELVHDGRLTDRWETTGNWHVDKDGVVTLKPRPGESGWRRFEHYIWSKDKFSDFEIEFDYRVEKKGNSGFYLRVGDRKRPVETGVEVQIFDSFGKAADSKLTDHDSGGIIPGIPPTANPALPAGEWNHFKIRVEGERLTVTLNAKVVNEITLDHPNIKGRPSTGFVGFQDHGLPLSLRNVQLRKL